MLSLTTHESTLGLSRASYAVLHLFVERAIQAQRQAIASQAVEHPHSRRNNQQPQPPAPPAVGTTNGEESL